MNGCGVKNPHFDLPPMDPMVLEEERKNFNQVIGAFKLYR